ncbi:hypothetical protein [Methylobacterium radiotolerans]|jgi:hypothetical protein|nr:hypothetical protein [Methylobacterium radiotolerans]MBN6818140.1 hypothetical protein [Methylobacterium organophilum]OXE43660.1 hypothetical protein CCS92_02155 [Methylobacterium radiotolerans]GAN46375.1 hypothetical protein ME121_0378 [Methylobacterium sp. ME121]
MAFVLEQARGDRGRNLVLLGISLLFVAAGLGMIVTGADGGVATTVFFGVCAAVAVWQLRPDLLESESRSAGSLAAQFPGPVTLRASLRRLLFLALMAAGFGGVTLWILLHETRSTTMHLLLWPGVVLFLGGVPVLILTAIRGSALQLDETGFTVVQLGRSRRARWHDVSEFAAVAAAGSGQRLVTFDDASAVTTRLGAMNRRLIGRNAALPDNYGLDPDTLATLLTAWRKRALQTEAGRL